MENNNILLKMTNISKTFPGVKALSNVDFTVNRGEVMGLLGENGAGKSTLIKIITGYYRRDSGSGEYLFDGKPVNPTNTLAAQKLGISTIFQELNLSPLMSIAENIYLGNQPLKNGIINWKKMNEDAKKAMLDLGIDVDVSKPINSVSTAIQQMTAIARAISTDAKLIIMDEATSSLDNNEVNTLFDVIRKLKAKGISVIFVTHKLDEVYRICDRGTILKDGKFVVCKPMSELPKLDLISYMLGRDAREIVNKKKVYNKEIQENETYYEARNIRKTNCRLNGINIHIKKGEVVGLAGLLGSGRTELAKVIFGDDQKYIGYTFLNGIAVKFRSPHDAVKNKLAFCSEDRKAEGIFPYMSVEDNITMPQVGKLSKFGLISRRKQKKITERYISKLSIKTPSSKTQIRDLSGGNQQKVIFSRWLAMEPDMIILDEPTRGIDVGAKGEIENIISSIAKQGISILYISSENDELVRNCDRVVVLYEGKNVKELVGEEISSESIMAAIAAGKS
ncbi:MAG: sugar ABC transporter ATP-binding protein [Clostridiaceae bacterium]|jgi:monosaccharide-transporting ATPase|nr:sugar ABC transporter ATP-binding protein [Clostridiaceae bacterium]